MNSTLVKIFKYAGFLLLSGISTWWTATSVYISGQNSTPLFVWIAVFLILSIIAAYIGLKGVKDQLSNADNPSFVKLCGFLLIWLVIWGFSFATNVHRNVISQYGYNNINAQLQSCKQYIERSLNTQKTTSENTIKDDKNEVTAQVNSLQDEFKRNMDNTKPQYVGFGSECIRILNEIENYLNNSNSLYHDHTKYVIYDDKNDAGDIGKKEYKERNELLNKYGKRISEAINKKHEKIDDYYRGVNESTEHLETLNIAIEAFENSEVFAVAEDSKDVVDIYKCYQSFKKDIIDKMPEEYLEHVNKKVSDADGNMRYIVYPTDRMFVFSNVWSDWWHGELPKDISLTGQFWLSFLIDFATYLLV